MSRYNARLHSFILIYGATQRNFFAANKLLFENKEEVEKIFDEYIDYLPAIAEYVKIKLDDDDINYLKEIWSGVCENIIKIDGAISAQLKKWIVSRLASEDLAILRLAAYEILFYEKTNAKVAINAAVDLAHKYGAKEKSYAFVNGTLSALYEFSKSKNKKAL